MLVRLPQILVLASVVAVCAARAEVYLKFEPVTGNAADGVYEDWIELNGIYFDINRLVDMNDLGSTQRGHANTTPSKIAAQKEFTTSSPLLFLATANGTVVPAAEIHCVRHGAKGSPIPYLKVKLRNALIDRFEQFAFEDEVPRETIALAYDHIELRSREFNGAGSPLGEQVATYDLIAGEVGGGHTPPPSNTAPTISSPGDQTTPEDTPVTINFTIGDNETAAGSLQLAKNSSNPALLPASRIGFGGSGASRSVTLNPAVDQFGSATVTLSVSDGQLSKSTSFTLTVSPRNDAPFISPSSSLRFVRSIPIQGVVVSDVDAGTNALSLAASVTQGSLFTNAVVSGLTVRNNGFAAVELDGSLGALNDLFRDDQGLIYQSYPNFSGTDVLSLTLTDDQGAESARQDVALNVFTSRYALWRDTHFTDEVDTPALELERWGDKADPDGDGLPNLLEYVLGLHPGLPDAGNVPRLVESTISGKRHFTVTVDRVLDPGVSLSIEVCDDLAGSQWDSDAAEISASNGVQSAEGRQIIFRDQRAIGETTNRFYRFKASRPE